MATSNKLLAEGAEAMPILNDHYCPIDFPKDVERDVINIKRTVNYPSGIFDRMQREIIVEVDTYLRFTRETGGLFLGDPIYAHTLLPGEKVRLASSDRRSTFSMDSESNLSYKSVQMSESQYFLSSLRHFSAESEATQSGNNESGNNGAWDFHGDAHGSIGFFSASASANAKGSYNNHSFSEYLNSQRYHAQSAESNSVEATNKAMSMSVGEVSTRSHQEGASEDHFESSSREFKNENKSHAVSYLFYRLNKRQTVTFEVTSIEMRIKDPNSQTGFTHIAPAATNIKLIPQYLPATSKIARAFRSEDAKNESGRYSNLSINTDAINRERLFLEINRPSFDAATRQRAIEKVKKELITTGIIQENGEPTPQLLVKTNFKKESSLPTAGIVVKGYIDECNTSEPLMIRRYELENERLALQNDLLRKQIDLLEKSQEYRCCDGKEDTPPIE